MSDCDPMDCSKPDFSVLHYLLELAQTHVQLVESARKEPPTWKEDYKGILGFFFCYDPFIIKWYLLLFLYLLFKNS